MHGIIRSQNSVNSQVTFRTSPTPLEIDLIKICAVGAQDPKNFVNPLIKLFTLNFNYLSFLDANRRFDGL